MIDCGQYIQQIANQTAIAMSYFLEVCTYIDGSILKALYTTEYDDMYSNNR